MACSKWSSPVCRLAGRLHGNGSRNRIRCAGSKQAGIVLILKSGDKGKYWKGGALCGDRLATKLPTIAETMERCVAGVCVAGKERRAAGRCDRREGNSLAERPGSAFFVTRVTKVHATLLGGFPRLFILDTCYNLSLTPSAPESRNDCLLFSN
jgi:hypothetical protein